MDAKCTKEEKEEKEFEPRKTRKNTKKEQYFGMVGEGVTQGIETILL